MSASTSLFTRSRAGREKCSGKLTRPRSARRYVPTASSASNGGAPASISNTSTPSAHQSAGFPWPRRRITSGAM